MTILFFHPYLAGFVSFTDYDAAYAFAEDIGRVFDLNSIGTLKSRGTIVHL